MLESLFSSKARVKILKLFLFNPMDSYYMRQIALLADLPILAVQREVKKLEQIGLLEKSVEGNRTYFCVKRGHPIFKELKGIFLKSSGIAEVIKRDLKSGNEIVAAFIYGSYAENKEKRSSDIDLMIIGDIASREVSKLLAKTKIETGREINYAVFTAKEAARKYKDGDNFITNVLKGRKIFVLGDNNVIRKITE